MKTKQILILGGTSGIGLHAAIHWLSLGNHVTVVGRDVKEIDSLEVQFRGQIQKIIADLSLISEVEQLAIKLNEPSFDIILFTAGMLSGKSWLTREGHEVNYITNDFSRYYLTEKLLPKLLLTERPVIGYISGWGDYKEMSEIAESILTLQKNSGLTTSLNSFKPNDVYFGNLSVRYPELRILAFNPGPTKGTKLGTRAHAPIFLRLIKPIFPLIATRVEDTGKRLAELMDAADKGIIFYKKANVLHKPDFLSNLVYAEQLLRLNNKIATMT
jgi:hypothetical protein